MSAIFTRLYIIVDINIRYKIVNKLCTRLYAIILHKTLFFYFAKNIYISVYKMSEMLRNNMYKNLITIS